MTRRQVSIVIALVLMNYIVFSLIISAVIGQNQPEPTPTRTPYPTFTPGPKLSRVTAPPPTPTAKQPTPTNTLVLPPTSTPRTGRVNHLVQPGETLSDIANRYGTPLEDLLNLNNLSDPDSILSGQEIVIPAPGETVPQATPTQRPMPAATRPPADTPTPAEPTATPKPECAYQFCPGPWYGGDPNAGLTRFYGHIKDTSGNAVNGFYVRAICGSYQVISFPTGPWSGGPYAEAGAWDISVKNEPLTLECTLQVVMYKCDEWFNAQCQQFDPLSEAVHVTTNADAGETIVVADWICYHDCDKGSSR